MEQPKINLTEGDGLWALSEDFLLQDPRPELQHHMAIWVPRAKLIESSPFTSTACTKHGHVIGPKC